MIHKPCAQFLHQCSKCKDYFNGTPINGHQCYRIANVGNSFCFDPLTDQNCLADPIALDHGRTVFFMVQPKYVNVDIRVTIDVTVGGKLGFVR